MKLMTFKKGFTLIEIILVIAIMMIVAALVMVSLEESRQKSRNTARVTQIREYQKVFNMYYSEYGYFPRASESSISGQSCLAKFATNSCWNNVTEKAWLVNAMTPKYINSIPVGENRFFGEPSRNGMMYQYTQYGKEYRIYYFMEGRNRDCLADNTTATPSGDDTLCTLQITI